MMNTRYMERIVLKGFMDVNCYLLESSGKCFIVDPGFEKERIIEEVTARGLEAIGILLTHAHADHIGAIDCFPVPIYIHEADKDMLYDADSNGFSSYGISPSYNIDDLEIVSVKDEDDLEIGQGSIKVIHSPGHTPGSVCYLFGKSLYTGDTLFRGSVGRWDFSGGDMLSLKKSIVSLVGGNDDGTHIFPGHGPSSTIGEERKHNKFYVSWRQNN